MGICGGKILAGENGGDKEIVDEEEKIREGDDAWMKNIVDSSKMMEMIVASWNMAGVNSNALEYQLSQSFPTGHTGSKKSTARAEKFAFDLSSLVENAVIGKVLEQKSRADFANKLEKMTVKDVIDSFNTGNPVSDNGKKIQKSIVQFAKQYFRVKVSILLRGTFQNSLVEVKNRFYVHAPPARALSFSSIDIAKGHDTKHAAATKMTTATTKKNDSKNAKRYGGKFFSRSDLKLKDRSWCITNVNSSEIDEFIASLLDQEKTFSKFWSHWLDNAVKNVDAKYCSDPSIVFPVIVYDFVNALACRALLEELDSKKVRSLCTSLKALFGSLCTDSKAKAVAMSEWLQYIVKRFSPDVVALQEFDATWPAEVETHRACSDFWKHMDANYDVFKPAKERNAKAQTRLLIKKTKRVARFVPDEAITKELQGLLKDGQFVKSVVRSIKKKCASQKDSIWEFDEEKVSADTRKTLDYRVVVCALRDSKNSGSLAIVVVAHAHSDGSDCRTIIDAALKMRNHVVASRKRPVALIIAMDANCKKLFSKTALIKGAADMNMFVSFALGKCSLVDSHTRRNTLRRGLRDRLARFFVAHDVLGRLSEIERLASEFKGRDDQLLQRLVKTYGPEPPTSAPVPPNGIFPLTVNKQRSFVQTQLNKAGVRDQSTKDWVFLGPPHDAPKAACACDAIVVNARPMNIATPSPGFSPMPPSSRGKKAADAKNNIMAPFAASPWFGCKDMYRPFALMPNPSFPSDHAMVISRAVWPKILSGSPAGMTASKSAIGAGAEAGTPPVKRGL